MSLGILFSLGALVSWGIGDFLIQKESRIAGTWQALFYITFLGALALTPYAWNDAGIFLSAGVFKLLVFTSAVTLIVAWLEFEALRKGKIAIIEPIMAFELPLTVLLGVTVGREYVSQTQAIIIFCVFAGILLLSYRMQGKHTLFERGVVLALIATVVMAVVNFSTAESAKATNPLAAMWFINVFLALASFGIMVVKREVRTIVPRFKKHALAALGMAIFDNAAWIFYAFAVTLIPISIAITISESYIILAIFLGIIFNKEKMQSHQWLGVSLSVIGVLVLSAVS